MKLIQGLTPSQSKWKQAVGQLHWELGNEKNLEAASKCSSLLVMAVTQRWLCQKEDERKKWNQHNQSWSFHFLDNVESSAVL